MQDSEQELNDLKGENSLLLGLMVGGYAYFLHHLMLGHQNEQGLSAATCEQIVVDALKRVLTTQDRFACEYLDDLEKTLAQMTRVLSLEPYLQKANREKHGEHLDP
ncbi:MAG: hypothetical protein HC934_13495 [Acaryochloridaceae cyanobacterium SU_2_1]|nr:hypothetical protein [Acaryochloridaceae cyanobacterium SU_2_1]